AVGPAADRGAARGAGRDAGRAGRTLAVLRRGEAHGDALLRRARRLSHHGARPQRRAHAALGERALLAAAEALLGRERPVEDRAEICRDEAELGNVVATIRRLDDDENRGVARREPAREIGAQARAVLRLEELEQVELPRVVDPRQEGPGEEGLP